MNLSPPTSVPPQHPPLSFPWLRLAAKQMNTGMLHGLFQSDLIYNYIVMAGLPNKTDSRAIANSRSRPFNWNPFSRSLPSSSLPPLQFRVASPQEKRAWRSDVAFGAL